MGGVAPILPPHPPPTPGLQPTEKENPVPKVLSVWPTGLPCVPSDHLPTPHPASRPEPQAEAAVGETDPWSSPDRGLALKVRNDGGVKDSGLCPEVTWPQAQTDQKPIIIKNILLVLFFPASHPQQEVRGHLAMSGNVLVRQDCGGLAAGGWGPRTAKVAPKGW